jgi:hypothetical protein
LVFEGAVGELSGLPELNTDIPSDTSSHSTNHSRRGETFVMPVWGWIGIGVSGVLIFFVLLLLLSRCIERRKNPASKIKDEVQGKPLSPFFMRNIEKGNNYARQDYHAQARSPFVSHYHHHKVLVK